VIVSQIEPVGFCFDKGMLFRSDPLDLWIETDTAGLTTPDREKTALKLVNASGESAGVYRQA
jgi:hypothetical protein